MTNTPWVDAFLFGIISAVSLPLGALLSFVWKPKMKVTAALMAFGAGALLAALTIDLVAVAVHNGHFALLALGCILGGIFYFVLNQIVNSKGGAKRKRGTSILYLKKLRFRHLKHLTEKISYVPLFHKLPAEELHHLVPYIQNRSYKKGKHLVHHDDPGDRLIIIEKGTVNLIDEDENRSFQVRENAILGELELLTGDKHPYSIVAETDVSVFVIHKSDFDTLVEKSPELSNCIDEIIKNEMHILKSGNIISKEKADEWYKKVEQNLEDKANRIKIQDISTHNGTKAGTVALAIWLGILLDGIPESFVIGSSLLAMGTMSLSLLAGLFLSNFPEALSSSVGLREQRFSKSKILIMWTSITLATGLGAIAGNVFFVGVSHSTLALVDGLAAGAMLTMIAETMLPEAFHLGGSVTGLSTLVGFLTTISCKFI
jgi:zinc transporter ZupT